MSTEGSHLYIFSGLPGTGKTTLAKSLSNYLKAVYLRIDTVEQGLRDLCKYQVEGEGYRLSYRVAADNLDLGNRVVSDSCNPINLTRCEWQEIASSRGVSHTNIEIVCSNLEEHKRRIETRKVDIDGLTLPSWKDVKEREYDPWESDRIVIDTASKMVRESFSELLSKLDNAT